MNLDGWDWVEIAQPPTAEELVVERLSDDIVARWSAGIPTTVTWLNHHSVRTHLGRPECLSRFDLVGIDGIFLQRIVPRVAGRSSADLILPEVLSRLLGCRVALVGGLPSVADDRVRAAQSVIGPRGDVVVHWDGFAGLPSPANAAAAADDRRVDVVIVGLGAPVQDRWAIELAAKMRRPALIVTCGGYLDQIQQPDYYPDWAYPLHLNWLVRLAREPRRLVSRYSTEVVATMKMRNEIASLVDALPGFDRYLSVLADPRSDQAATPKTATPAVRGLAALR